jgi:KaiC/GvpD/RAD55 family RecA-like ATPase
MPAHRLSTGLPRLDELLGGGVLPGTLTVVLGATGIGKTQLGIHFADAGRKQEGERGFFFDMTSRGDSPEIPLLFHEIWDRSKVRRDSLHVFRQTGKRVTMSDLDDDQKIEWKAELNRKLEQTIAFFYGNFVHGVRRCVIDGMEPADRASDSFQFERFEYIYQQILRKEAEWVARDLFRAHYRENSEVVARHAYNHADVGCLLLCTTHETMLDALIERPIESGDVLSNANTIILMGKTKADGKMGRALYVAKHRGSACLEEIVPYTIDASGLVLG